MPKTAVFTVIFPGNLKYFDAFLDSLVRQTERSFDLLLLVDGVSDIEKHLAGYRDELRVVCRHASGSIAAMRQLGIGWIIEEGYDYVVFADSDDMLKSDRVSASRKALEKYPIVANDVIPFVDAVPGSPGGIWRSRMESYRKFSAHDLLTFNFAGLGNTAARVEALRVLDIPESLIAVDWYLFYHWLQGATGVFVHEGCTLYRQHALNVAGVGSLTASRLLHIVSVKIRHYRSLGADFPEVMTELERHEKMEANLTGNPGLLIETVTELNQLPVNYFWWEETQYIK